MNNNLQGFIQNYRQNGHMYSKLDPLGLSNTENTDSAFDLDYWQLSEIEPIEGFPLDYRYNSYYKDNLGTVSELKEYLDQLYSQTVGVEFEHVENENERLWLYENYEKVMGEHMSKAEKMTMLTQILRAELFEKFLHKKFPGYKRYSSEGSETLISALNTILAEASYTDHENPEANIHNVVIGMPHRGRLTAI